MKKMIAVLVVGLVGLVGLVGQCQTTAPGVDPNNSPTNLIAIPNAPLNMFLNALPAWEPDYTNAFQAGDLYIETAPLFKALMAAGSSPYLSLSGEYYISTPFGLGAELVTLGSGQGNSAVDSTSVYALGRLGRGNIAFYGMAGIGEDWGLRKFMGQIGGGVRYQYHTAFGIFSDARYCITGTDAKENGWMSRIGISFNFR